MHFAIVCEKEAFSSHSRLRVPPVAANRKRCVRQQAANRSVVCVSRSVALTASFNESFWYFKGMATFAVLSVLAAATAHQAEAGIGLFNFFSFSFFSFEANMFRGVSSFPPQVKSNNACL